MKKIAGFSELQRALARALKKPVVYLSWNASWENFSVTELLKAAPILDIEKDFQSITEGFIYIVCESLQEMQTLYDQVVGDDGPSSVNPYSGPARVYALTCDDEGALLNENT